MAGTCARDRAHGSIAGRTDDGHRAYRLGIASFPVGNEPDPIRLTAFDLDATTEIGSVEIQEVRAGTIEAGRTVGGAPFLPGSHPASHCHPMGSS